MHHSFGLYFIQKSIDVLAVEDVEFDDVRRIDPGQACTDGFPSCAGELALYLLSQETAGYVLASVVVRLLWQCCAYLP